MTAPTIDRPAGYTLTAADLSRALGRPVSPELVDRARRAAADAPPLTDDRAGLVARIIRRGPLR